MIKRRWTPLRVQAKLYSNSTALMLVEFLKQPISPNLNTTIGLLCLDLSGYQVRYVEWNLYSKGDGHCGDQQTNFGADLHSYVRSVDKIWQDIPSDGKKVHCHDSHPGCSGTWNQRVRITQLLSKEYTLTTAQLVRRGAAMYTELDSCRMRVYCARKRWTQYAVPSFMTSASLTLTPPSVWALPPYRACMRACWHNALQVLSSAGRVNLL